MFVRATNRVIAFVFALICPMAFGQSAETILLTGATAPGSKGGIFKTFGQVDSNDSGAIVFNARVEGGSTKGGVYLEIGDSITPVVTVGQPVPDVKGAVFSGMSNPRISNSGSILFWGRYEGAEEGYHGLFLYSDGELLTVALQNSSETEEGTEIRGITDFDLNNRDEVIFVGGVVTKSGDQTAGLFRWSRGIIETIVVPGEQPIGTIDPFLPASPSINDLGDVFFVDLRPINLTGATQGSRVIALPSDATAHSVLDRRVAATSSKDGVFLRPGSQSISAVNQQGTIVAVTSYAPGSPAGLVAVSRGGIGSELASRFYGVQCRPTIHLVSLLDRHG